MTETETPETETPETKPEKDLSCAKEKLTAMIEERVTDESLKEVLLMKLKNIVDVLEHPEQLPAS